uniref:F-box domain-containing protein n=1 Tax=Acrobeloides nanus TaxID=290746 RepID=A0A914C056_9BILA
MSSEPSTSSLNDSFQGIPEEILLQVLKNLNSAELLRSRLISQRFKRVYKTNAHRLARPKIDHITFHVRNSIPAQQLGRLRMPETNLQKKYKKKLCVLLKKRSKRSATTSSSSMNTVRSQEFDFDNKNEEGNSANFLRALQDTMRKFSITESLCFDGCVISPKLIEQFIEPYSDISSIQSLSFVLCDLCVTVKDICELISRISCSTLCIEFCTGTEKIITDKLFAQIQELKTLRLQTRDYHQLIDLTDDTLLRWAMQKELPQTIEMSEIRCGFTLLGVLALIGELKSRLDLNQISNPVTWDLGSITVNIVDFMQFLTLQGLFFNIQNVAPNSMRVSIDLSQQAPLFISNHDQSWYGLNSLVFPRQSTRNSCRISFQLMIETKIV